jgi:hypothetical protein
MRWKIAATARMEKDFIDLDGPMQNHGANGAS